MPAAKRIANKLSQDDRLAMKEWLVAAGIPESEIDIADTEALLAQWTSNYDPKKNVTGHDERQAQLLCPAEHFTRRSPVNPGGHHCSTECTNGRAWSRRVSSISLTT